MGGHNADGGGRNSGYIAWIMGSWATRLQMTHLALWATYPYG
ncbi:hypothetical protein A2U01_0079997, partial [Trifolium medium]|nr:hypothetical protein [Trifolium medium]